MDQIISSNAKNWFPLIIAAVGGVAAIMWWKSYLANQSAQQATSSSQFAPGTQVSPDIGQAITDVPGVGPSGVGPWWMYYNTPSTYAFNPALTPVSGFGLPSSTQNQSSQPQQITTGSTQPITTGSTQPITTGSTQPITTGSTPTPAPTPPSGPTPPGGPYSGPSQPSVGGTSSQPYAPGAPI